MEANYNCLSALNSVIVLRVDALIRLLEAEISLVSDGQIRRPYCFFKGEELLRETQESRISEMLTFREIATNAAHAILICVTSLLRPVSSKIVTADPNIFPEQSSDFLVRLPNSIQVH
jgi:hypothetical protein